MIKGHGLQIRVDGGVGVSLGKVRMFFCSFHSILESDMYW